MKETKSRFPRECCPATIIIQLNYYTIDPSLAMSGNVPFNQRMLAREGVVKKIEHTDRGYYVLAEFDE